MTIGIRVTLNPRRSPPATAVVIATAGLALLASACGGAAASSTTAAASGQANGVLAFSDCMRSHGLSSFPDPNSSGVIPKTEVIPLASSPRFQPAQRACQHLLPNTGSGGSTQIEVRQALSGMVRFAACMRTDGVQNWPDPTVDRDHPDDPRPVFDLLSINPSAPQISADIRNCQHVMPQSTSPYMCSRALAEQIGGPPGALACTGGSPAVP
ncbi:MAG TPA: hypothetical protein VMA77_01870 [Solirubrobacteraceae bacterium]|nr:hypothetical protein [Solirubrobacteraceae bacterium]